VDGGLQRSVAGDMNIGTTETTNTVTIGRSGQTQALAGNATVSGSLRVGSGITVGAGQGLDVAAAGELKLGDAIATTISIGSGGAATLNLGTGSDAKTVNIATGTGGNSINLGTDDTLADTVAIGSPKDTVSLDGAALNVGAS